MMYMVETRLHSNSNNPKLHYAHGARELHDHHNDLPFMCEKIRVSGVEKLVPNLHDKKKYVIHIKAFKQALDHGLVLEKIHRVIQFKQAAWMKEYIDFNTRLRTVAKNDFEKDFYKLMNNSVFGKTIENIRKHRDIKLVNNKEDYLKQVMKPNFKGGVLMGADLMSCEMGKVKVKMNKPVYLGQAILDLSKTIIYEFHYDYMKRKYNESDLKLLYMDTDWLVYDIKTEDFYKDIAKDVETRFDTSGYEPNRPLPIGKNKKVIGLMKDELGGKIMKEFIGLRPKMYSYKIGEKDEPKKCKGIKKCVVKKTISIEDYKRCLFEGRVIHRSQMMFRSRKHKVKTLEVNKLALSREDDKRININGIDSLAMGHYKVKSSGGSNYKSVKFAYDGGEIPPICKDGDFRLFRFRNKNSDTYSLSITCDPTNESFFRELNEVITEESCKILKDESIKPEDFKLIRDNRSGRSVYTKIYSKRSGKVKCRYHKVPIRM